jgi:hypothetical protein
LLPRRRFAIHPDFGDLQHLFERRSIAVDRATQDLADGRAFDVVVANTRGLARWP